MMNHNNIIQNNPNQNFAYKDFNDQNQQQKNTNMMNTNYIISNNMINNQQQATILTKLNNVTLQQMDNSTNNKQVNSKDQMNEFFVNQMSMQGEEQNRVYGYDQRVQPFNQINNNIDTLNQQGEKLEEVQQFNKNIEMNQNFNYQNNIQGNFQGNYIQNIPN